MRRTDQLLASLGYGSRREVAWFCKQGRVTLGDGTAVARADTKVDAADLRFDGRPLDHPAGVLVVMHKPVGYVCSHDEAEGPLIYDLLPKRWRLRHPVPSSVGRLDKDTSGVLLVTDDGGLLHRLVSPKHRVEKVYVADLDGDPGSDVVEAFASGTMVLANDPKPCLPAQLDPLGGGRARVTLTEGRYHQVRRMFAACGLHVESLHRERFGALTVADLEPGEWRSVTEDEVSR